VKINLEEFIMGVIQDKKKLALVVILIIVFLYVDFFLVWKIQISALKNVNLKITKVKTDLKNFKSDLVQANQSGNKIITSKIKKSIFEDQISWLIEEIYKLSRTNKVELIQIKSTADITRSAALLPGLKATPFLLTLEATSGYNQLARFIEALESHPVFLAVDSLEIARGGKDIFLQQVKLTLTAYVSKR
jgi:hypothetical protein